MKKSDCCGADVEYNQTQLKVSGGFWSCVKCRKECSYKEPPADNPLEVENHQPDIAYYCENCKNQKQPPEICVWNGQGKCPNFKLWEGLQTVSKPLDSGKGLIPKEGEDKIFDLLLNINRGRITVKEVYDEILGLISEREEKIVEAVDEIENEISDEIKAHLNHPNLGKRF